MIVRILPRAKCTVISVSYGVFFKKKIVIIKQVNKHTKKMTISTFVTLEMCRACQTAF